MLLVLSTTVTSLAASVAPAGATTNPGDINTVAGTVLPGPAQALQTGQTPVAVAVDGAGAFAYIADITYNVVRRYDINTLQEQVVAGTGVSGYSGDTGQATAAQLNSPSGVAVDGSGNLFIVDRGNNRVRKVVNGVISTIVGTGTAGFNGDGPGTAVQLNDPVGIALDSAGNAFISDRANNRVREWVASSGQLVTVAGNGTAGFSGDSGLATSAQLNSPSALATDGSGNVFVSDYGNDRVRVFAVGGGIITFAGTGVYGFSGDLGPGVPGNATSAKLALPQGLAVSGGDVFISDSFNSRIRKVTGGIITTVAGSDNAGFNGDGPATTTQLRSPWAIAVNAGNVYVPDFLNNRVRRFTVGGNMTTIAGAGAPGTFAEPSTATSTQLNFPGAVATSGADFYVADTATCRIRKISGGNISTVAGSTCGTGAQQLDSPGGVVVTAGGDVYIADTGNCQVKKLTGGTGSMSVFAGSTCGFGGDGSSAGMAQLNRPSGLAVTATDLYIADRDNAVVRKVTLTSPTITTVAGTPGTPTDLLHPIGDGGAATSATLSAPSAVEVSGTDLYIADKGNCLVRKVTGGTISTFAGTTCGFSGDGAAATSAQLANPSDIAIDSLGIVYIADTGNNRVRKVVSGTISTRVGTGTAGFSGDGGQAGLAKVAGPQSLAVDASRNLYLADTSNSRIRRVEAPQSPGSPTGATAVAGQGSGVVSWVAPVSDGGAPITGYTVTASPDGAQCSWTGGPLSCTVFGLSASKSYTFSVTATNEVGTSSPSASSGLMTPLGPFGFHPVQPARILDSRTGTGGYSTPWGPAVTRGLQVTGAGGVPLTGVSAVVMNVTVTATSGPGQLTVFPGGDPLPLASNLNWGAGGVSVANLVTVAVPASGVVNINNGYGSTAVIADVVGWFDTGTQGGDLFTSLQPTRILDSRVNLGVSGSWTPSTPNHTKTLQVSGTGGVPSNATAVVMNVTATNTSGPGNLSAFPSGTTPPTASNLNWGAPGTTRPNLVTVKLGTGTAAGKVDIESDYGSADVIGDVVGYYSAGVGDGLHAVSPVRLLDSRNGTGGYSTPWAPGTNRSLKVVGTTTVPAQAKAVVLNVTITGPNGPGQLTVYPTGLANPPTASNLNWAAAGETNPNLVVVQVGTGGSINFYNPYSTVSVLADLVGWYG